MTIRDPIIAAWADLMAPPAEPIATALSIAEGVSRDEVRRMVRAAAKAGTRSARIFLDQGEDRAVEYIAAWVVDEDGNGCN